MHTGCGSRIQFTDADHRRATGRQGSPSKFSRNTAPWRWHRCAAGIIRGHRCAAGIIRGIALLFTIALLLPYCFGGEAMSKNGVVGWFNSLPRLAQLILLLIPGVNWVIEILVRWSGTDLCDPCYILRVRLRLAGSLVVPAVQAHDLRKGLMPYCHIPEKEPVCRFLFFGQAQIGGGRLPCRYRQPESTRNCRSYSAR